MMVTVPAGKIAVVAMWLVVLAAVGGCSREQQDWRSAESADTLASYGEFIDRHPDSELVRQAHTRIAQLGEDRDWKQAGGADTAEAYEQFLAKHPNGKWAQAARIRMENFELGAAPAAGTQATAAGTTGIAGAGTTGIAAGAPAVAAPPGGTTAAWSTAAVPDAASVVPGVTAAASAQAAPTAAVPRIATVVPAPTAAAPTPAALSESAPDGYGIQLGAFSSEDRANSEWQALVGRFGPELQGLAPQVVPAETTSGRVYRLQAQAGDEGRARLICDALRKRSQPCVPVVPH